jgi:DNA-binding NtrC family response regulator
MAHILVVDDEHGIRDLLWEVLNDEGHAVTLAENAAQARAARAAEVPDLVLLDIWMPDMDGVTLLKEWAAGGLLTMPVIMMSGHATIDTAVEATKIGALAFLEKPVTLQKLLSAVDDALKKDEPPPTPSAPLKFQAAAIPVPVPSVAQSLQSFSLDLPLRQAKDIFEKAYFEFHLHHEGGSMTRVSEKTGLERTHLYRKLKQLGVELSKEKSRTS